ncbi:MAG: formate--tetrahydrofolate ligase [Pseudomonadota bacterium]
MPLLSPGASDIDIARAAQIKPIAEIAEQRLKLRPEEILPYGHHKAKVSLETVEACQTKQKGKLVLVTAISPTPAGEGKTTTTVGLTDGLNHIGLNAMACLREPSMVPCFGMKGGAAGGGHAQVIPMEDINLHFTGDFHAITSAHNLLSAMVDNSLHWNEGPELDPRRITWRRVVDMNDRALRNVNIGLGGPTHGVPREAGFDITVASEVMATLCLADGLDDLKQRLGRMIVGRRRDKTPVTASDLNAHGAMTVLLREAVQPNLVQTIENNPVLIHGGPFANIAHGCNSVIATRTALGLADIVVTEAGFGADLGAEKFMNIKCRQSDLRPDAVVLVCTIKALKMHGGTAKSNLMEPDASAVSRGLANLTRHVENLQRFGLSPVVAINHFAQDTEVEISVIRSACDALDVKVVLAKHWAEGGAGAADLAEAVKDALSTEHDKIVLSYEDSTPLTEKIEAIADTLYHASDVQFSMEAQKELNRFEGLGFGHLPVCMAKTPYSFSEDPSKVGAAENHTLHIRDARLSAGAGFVVALCGDVMTMPGLPRRPAALGIDLDTNGDIVGLS